MFTLLYTLLSITSHAEIIAEKNLTDVPKAAAAISLVRNSESFQKIFEPLDHGTLANNSDLVFESYDVTEDGGGVTKFQIQNNNGEWIWVSNKLDPATISNNSKVRILIFINPNEFGDNRVSIADVMNHEVMVHGAPLLKTLSILREYGSTAFVQEWSYSSSVTSWDNAETINTKYNGPFVGHALAALGKNEDYNNVTKDIRKQLKPQEQVKLDGIIKNNPKYYAGDIQIYYSFLKKH